MTTPRTEGAAALAPFAGRARLEGPIELAGRIVRFPPRAAAVVVDVDLAPGTYLLELRAEAPRALRLELLADIGPVPVPLAQEGTLSRARFRIAERLARIRLMLVEAVEVAFEAFSVTPEPPWTALLPDWTAGPVALPPAMLFEGLPVVEGPPPQAWDGCRIEAVQGLSFDGARVTVGPAGVAALSLSDPAGGWWRCEADLFDASGGPALVEPRLSTGRGTPVDGVILRPASGARHVADIRLDDGAERLLFRPRLERGMVEVRRFVLRPASPREVAERHARGVRRALGGGWSRAAGGLPRPRRRARDAAPATPGKVSIVVATRDAPQHLARFLATLEATAPGVERVLVDNATRDPRALMLLAAAEKAGARVIRDDRPFNFAALANEGAAKATGDLLVFANNDLAFEAPGWLERLVAPLADDSVGVTGARLLYPDGRLQHGGVVLAGEARVRHAERYLPWWAPGHGGRQRRTGPVVAVTGALLAIRRSLFEALGGFDASRYGVLFNDIDLCLRVRERGLSVLYVPGAEAVHHESISIGARQTFDPFARGGAIWRLLRTVEADHFRGDWASLIDADPCYPAASDPVEALFRRR